MNNLIGNSLNIWNTTISKTILAWVLASVVSSTSVNAWIVLNERFSEEILEKCDFNNDWAINGKSDFKAWLVTKKESKKEIKCMLNVEGELLDSELQKLKKIEKLLTTK